MILKTKLLKLINKNGIDTIHALYNIDKIYLKYRDTTIGELDFSKYDVIWRVKWFEDGHVHYGTGNLEENYKKFILLFEFAKKNIGQEKMFANKRETEKFINDMLRSI